jgi:hypothetical protein
LEIGSMVHRVTALVLGVILSLTLALPAMAADFPEQPGDLPACAVVPVVPPKDFIALLLEVSPATAARLIAQLTDACNVG